jgi:predicted phosphate transport protein (TIGR00153 family)
MFNRFLPKEEHFFELFEASANCIVEALNEFKIILDDQSRIELQTKRIEEIEHKADEVTHTTMGLLHKTFITPLEREDIHSLITQLDNIVDVVNAAAQRILMYQITKKTTDFSAMVDVCTKSAELIKETVFGLNNLKNPSKLLNNCIEINRLENECDHLLRIAVSKLFKDETDIKTLIKYKELYELLESVSDRCEDVANTVEGIVLEYA